MKSLIYPYSDELFSLFNNTSFLKYNLDVKILVYPRAWTKLITMMNDSDDILVTSDYENSVLEVDCVIIADVSNKDFMYSDILKKIESALEKNKKVIICTKINKSDIDALRIRYPEADIKVIYNDLSSYDYSSTGHKSLDCIIVGVAPIFRGLDTMNAVTGLFKSFKNSGYKPVVVSQNQTGRIIGFCPFPSDVWTNNTDIEQKVEQLNCYFSHLEETEKPDLIILQFPDGLMKCMKESIDSYGVKAYMISRAVFIDYFVMVSSYDNYCKDSYDQINNYCSNHFGFNIDSTLIQRIRLEKEYVKGIRNMSYTRHGLEARTGDIDNLINLSDSGMIFDKVCNEKAYERIVRHCVKKLSR